MSRRHKEECKKQSKSDHFLDATHTLSFTVLRTYGPPHRRQPQDSTPRLQDRRHRPQDEVVEGQERLDQADEEEAFEPEQIPQYVSQKVLRVSQLSEASISAPQGHQVGRHPSVGEGPVRPGQLPASVSRRQDPRHVLPQQWVALLQGDLGAIARLRRMSPCAMRGPASCACVFVCVADACA